MMMNNRHIFEVTTMITFSLVEFIYGYVNLGRAVCVVENESMNLVNVPLWFIIKAMVEMHLAWFMILVMHMCSNTRCKLRWTIYMWIVSFLHTVWTIVGLYLLLAECFLNRNIGDGLFVAFSVAMGLIFANLNFRIIFSIGNEDDTQHEYGRWNIDDDDQV